MIIAIFEGSKVPLGPRDSFCGLQIDRHIQPVVDLRYLVANGEGLGPAIAYNDKFVCRISLHAGRYHQALCTTQ